MSHVPVDLGEPLDAMQQRILGCLMEKQITVPASYPLTLNALRTACNQTSSRDPVTTYESADLERCTRDLKHRELLRVVVADRGQRTLKYHQRLDERLGLNDPGRALLTVLLLRGPQTAGELRTRSERLHQFPDRAVVEDALHELRDRGLVCELARRPGQHDSRWVHTLGPVDAWGHDDGASSTAHIDREMVLAAGHDARDAKVRTSYDAAAAAYADGQAHDLTGRPFDAWLLSRLADEVGVGPVADVGCGVGKVAGFLASQGVQVSGYDLSPAMIEQAQRRFPDVPFAVGDLRRLLRPSTAAGWAAVTSWYSLVYLAPSELPAALQALARVVQPGGLLLLAVHAGTEVHHESELAGVLVDLDLVLHDPVVFRGTVEAAGLQVVEWYLRGPVDDEYPSDRLYVLARVAHT
ncbi:Trans-aconitate 2-methyltransferase [Austwickia sp. TVS 96-490-7B]|uniref:DUF480 domain-containing protein n=1 Tax=Austwickia sp. TVS 96-490-7B TaxID=2830843 RepID=UPI001DE5439A|nr:DUF480 domain-containing protein [Austwickia sp. TVS 96-490-7B]MBW3085994.1 Trans-aconitate 2-methyltransferase [Austwickia sp. TVS 96-490-7B]